MPRSHYVRCRQPGAHRPMPDIDKAGMPNNEAGRAGANEGEQG
jgi:hypothetical protein